MELTEEDAIVMIAEGLIALARLQRTGAENLPEYFRNLNQQDFRNAALGCFVELGELVNEAQWKPWRQYSAPTPAERQKVVKEYADVLHFIAWMTRNLCSRFDLTAYTLARGFVAVHRENVARFKGQVPGREPPRVCKYCLLPEPNMAVLKDGYLCEACAKERSDCQPG